MFLTHLENFLPFSSNLKLSSVNSFSLEASKICCMGRVKPPFFQVDALYLKLVYAHLQKQRCLWNTNVPTTIFQKLWGICMWNMKALSRTMQKLWPIYFPNSKFFALPKWKSLHTTISNLMKMFSKLVENTVEKEEIACYKQFLLSHCVFKRFVL